MVDGASDHIEVSRPTKVAPLSATVVRQRRFGIAAAIAWFSLVYLPVSVLFALRKNFWNDELFTYYIAGQPGIKAIWTALLAAADQNPPLFYWLTHWSMRLPGDSRLLLRLPELAAFWLLGVCLIAIVARYLPPAFGLVTALLALTSGAYVYAYEARPYALVLALAATAFTCWQRSGSSLWAIGLALSLAAAVSVHYYSVLLFVPFGLAELVRTVSERRLRAPVWIAMALGIIPLLCYLPLIKSSRKFATVFWGRPNAGSVQEFLFFAMGSAIVPICLLAIWAGTRLLVFRPETGLEERRNNVTIPLCDFVCIASFIGLPLLAVVLARVVTGAYSHRYVIAAVIGLCIFISCCFGRTARAKTGAALVAAACLSLYFLVWQVHQLRWLERNNHLESALWLQKHAPSATRIGVLEPHIFFELWHQSPELRDRVFYVAEPAMALRYIGTDAVDRGVLGMEPWVHFSVVPLRDFLALKQPILLYSQGGAWSWLIPYLAQSGVPLSVVSADTHRTLWNADLRQK